MDAQEDAKEGRDEVVPCQSTKHAPRQRAPQKGDAQARAEHAAGASEGRSAHSRAARGYRARPAQEQG